MELEMTAEERSVLKPETAAIRFVSVGTKQVAIRPMSYRWQTLFLAAAMPIYDIELSSIERILRILGEGAFTGASAAGEIIQSEIDSVSRLGRAAAVILASQISGSDQDTEKHVLEQLEYVMGASNIDELRQLVDLQAEKEQLVKRVGERLPERFAKLLNLSGQMDVTAASVKLLLTSSLQKLQVLNGVGS